jgi:hypothetical protein
MSDTHCKEDLFFSSLPASEKQNHQTKNQEIVIINLTILLRSVVSSSLTKKKAHGRNPQIDGIYHHPHPHHKLQMKPVKKIFIHM